MVLIRVILGRELTDGRVGEKSENIFDFYGMNSLIQNILQVVSREISKDEPKTFSCLQKYFYSSIDNDNKNSC